MSEKITREFFENNPRVILRPETEGEAIYIQKILSGMGIKWCNGDAVGKNAEKCVESAMVVQDLILYTNPDSKPAITLPTSALTAGVVPYDLLTEPEKLRHDFNALRDEVTTKLNHIIELLESRPLPTIPAKKRQEGNGP